MAAGKRLWNPCWEGHPRINLNLSYLIIHFGGFNLGFPSTWFFGMIKKQPFTKYGLLPKIRFFTQKMIFWIQGCIIFWVPKFRGLSGWGYIYIYTLYISCIQLSFLAWMLVVDVLFFCQPWSPGCWVATTRRRGQSEDLPGKNEDFAATKNGSATSDVKTLSHHFWVGKQWT